MIFEARESRGQLDTTPVADKTSYTRRWRAFRTNTFGTFNNMEVTGDTIVLTRNFVSPLYDEPMLGKPFSDIPASVTLEGNAVNAEGVTKRSRFYRRQASIVHREV